MKEPDRPANAPPGEGAIQIDSVNRVLIRVVVIVRRSARDRIGLQEPAELRHVVPLSHCRYPAGKLGLALLASEPAVAGRRQAPLWDTELTRLERLLKLSRGVRLACDIAVNVCQLIRK